MRINRTSVAAISIVGGIALSQAFVASASAEDVPVDVHYSSDTAKTTEYGQFWTFEVGSDGYFYELIYNPGLATVSVTGAPSGYSPELSMYQVPGDSWAGAGTVFSPYDVAPLGVGSYVITISGEYDNGGSLYHGETSPSATLTVEKAKLGIELRVVADPAAPDSMVVTARFTGRFVDEYQSSFFPAAAKSPEGTWHVVIKDEKGEVATERTVERSAGDDILATSFYWADAEPGVKYTASAEFVASGSSAANFSVSNAQNFDFTGVETQRPVPTSTATGKPDAALPEATGFGLPVWSLIVIGVLIAGLAALITILSVRLSRRSTTGTGAVEA